MNAARRVVVKIGSALLVESGSGEIRRDWLKTLCADVAALKRDGKDVILVSSGAIALGRRALRLKPGGLKLEESQAAAAVGQVLLAHAYADIFANENIVAAQVLLTLGDTEERARYLNARATLKTLLSMGSVPVINENDTVATAEIRFGDNDRLAARVASMMEADCLVLLSDVDGLYTADPTNNADARHIADVPAITREIEAMAGTSISGVGRGGMVSKLIAAKIAAGAGCETIIAKGAVEHPIKAIEAGAKSTRFHASTTPAQARKRWIAGVLKPQGVLIVDAGAARALSEGKSLLPAGIRQIDGRFERGDAVAVRDSQGNEIARGLSAYNATDAERIAGKKSHEIEAILGYRGRDEMIHRDDLALTDMPMSAALRADMLEMGNAAREAARVLRESSPETKNKALLAAAAALRADALDIISANASDMMAAIKAKASPAMLDRLTLTERSIGAIASGLEAIAALPDPVGRTLAHWTQPNGLDISRVVTPIGVIGMIYESRPNVTADAAGLCLKSGNAVLLRGGSDAMQSNIALHDAILKGLRAAGLPEAAVQLVQTTDRDAVGLMLEGLNGAIDLIIPRGGKSLVKRVQDEARVPVLAHLEGICHVYVHKAANADMARKIVLNAKMRRTGVCGAAETLLIDKNILATTGVAVLNDLAASGCEIRGADAVHTAFPSAKPASEEDWRTEYLDAIIAVKVVDGVEDAIRHIETYGSHHTESIVTEDQAVAERFLAALDSAIVLWNASTQFADGGEFGMGAEIGIGTGKLHARGPVGVEQLTTFKYVVRGSGQIRP